MELQRFLSLDIDRLHNWKDGLKNYLTFLVTPFHANNLKLNRLFTESYLG